jgi:hypothetical protein
MDLYAHGGHTFGLRRTKFPITGWPQLVETWLGTIGMFSEIAYDKRDLSYAESVAPESRAPLHNRFREG